MGSHHVFIHLTNQGLSESPLGPVWLSLTSPVCPNETVPSTDQTYLQRCADEMTFKFGWHSQVPLKHLAATGQKGFPQGSGTSQGAHSLGVLSSHSSLFLGVLRPLRVESPASGASKMLWGLPPEKTTWKQVMPWKALSGDYIWVIGTQEQS